MKAFILSLFLALSTCAPMAYAQTCKTSDIVGLEAEAAGGELTASVTGKYVDKIKQNSNSDWAALSKIEVYSKPGVNHDIVVLYEGECAVTNFYSSKEDTANVLRGAGFQVEN